MIRNLTEFVFKVFDTKEYEVRDSFPMLHAGWECDEEIVMIVVRDRLYAIGSSHGSPCVLSKQDLLEKAKEYQEVLNATLKAVKYL
jgi:hypothetical protein